MATGTLDDPIILSEHKWGGCYEFFVHRKIAWLTRIQRNYDSYSENRSTKWWDTYQDKLKSSFGSDGIIEIVGDAITAGDLKQSDVFKILSTSDRKFRLYLEHPDHDPFLKPDIPPPFSRKGDYVWRVRVAPADRSGGTHWHNNNYQVGRYIDHSPPDVTDQQQKI